MMLASQPTMPPMINVISHSIFPSPFFEPL
jgi:hypothetical protein